MKIKLDTEFGNLAVSEGFVTPEHVNTCQHIVDAFKDTDPRKSIDVIMVDRGYITHDQWDYLLKTLGITVVLCPYCNKRFKEANADLGDVAICKYCGKEFKYKELPELQTHQTSTTCDKTLASLQQQTYDLYLGKLLGEKYKIIEKIAVGGWSTIYKAKRMLLDIDDIVAVKILHLNLSDNSQDIKRFYNEAATIRELHHPNAIHLYDFDRDANGTIYMAMEFIYGKNLKDTIKDACPFEVARMLNIIFQVCDVISTAHKHPKKIIHRDITPQNIMLTKVGEIDDFVKVLDFGIAKLRTHDNVSLTGSIVGTPLYMAPEQWRGECDERTDIYSLGVIMYEMLAGEPPFKGDQITLMNKHLNEKPPPFRKLNKNLKIPKNIENIVFKCLEKNKEKRPQSIDELRLLLQKVERPNTIFTNFTKTSILIIPAILVLSLALYILFLPKEREIDKQWQQSQVHKRDDNSLYNKELSKNIPEINSNALDKPKKISKETQTELLQNNSENKISYIDPHKVKDSDLNLSTNEKVVNDNKKLDTVVDNTQKYDINKNVKWVLIKLDPKQIIKNEIQTWLKEYKRAWEEGDIKTLQMFGHISSEKEENKLRQHYSYVHDVKVSIQNELIEVNGDENQVTVSFDRTDEWTDERGNRHKEDLPRITKTLHKENNTWKIAK